jgi:hypothetical protein
VSLERTLAEVTPAVRAILERCLEGERLSVADAFALCSARGRDLQALALAADA